MAQSRLDLHAILKALTGVTDAYFQPKMGQDLAYPVIVYERDDSFVAHADNLPYVHMKRYSVTVIDRDPDSLIPDLVEGLPYARFDRFFVINGLNHTVFNLYF